MSELSSPGSGERKFNSNLGARMEKLIKAMAGSDENWKPRYQALEELEKIVSEGSAYNSFEGKFSKFHDDLAIALEKHLRDLRSEIVRQTCSTIGTMARELGHSMQKIARKIMPTLIEVSSARNVTIRGYAQKCGPIVIQYVHSKGILYSVMEALNSTKSSLTTDCCMDYIRTALAFWPFKTQFEELADTLEEAIIFGLQSASADTRNAAVKCFWLYSGHFADRHESFLSELDLRTRRLVEKGKTIEEEQKEEEEAQKIAAAVKSQITKAVAQKKAPAPTPAAMKSEQLVVGMRVKTEYGQSGVIRYLGELKGKTGHWVGIETDVPADGNGSGSVGGIKYFDCKPKTALFVRSPDAHPEQEPEQPKEEPVQEPVSPAPLEDDDVNELKDPSFPKAPHFPVERSRSRASSLADEKEWEIDPALRTGAINLPKLGSPTAASGSGSGSEATGDGHSHAAASKNPTLDALHRKLSASTRQLKLEELSLAHSTQREDTHNRELSLPVANEREFLIREHKYHLGLMGDVFQTEMDLLQHEQEHPNSEEYVTSMMTLLDELAKRSLFLKNKYTDYHRHMKNQELLQDEFLTKHDKF